MTAKLNERDVVAAVERVTLKELRLWVREGWIAPATGEAGPAFDETDVARIRLVCDLMNELALGRDAVPVVLSLIDQLHGVRRELRNLARAVEQQPEDVRRRVRDAYRRLPRD